MPVLPATSERPQRWRRYSTAGHAWRWVATLVLLMAVGYFAGEMLAQHSAPLSQAGGIAADIADRMFPADWPDWRYAGKLWQPFVDTVHIATLGTLLAILLASPLAVLAARNTTPHRLVRYVAVVIIVSTRSINSLIWALLFVKVVGFGVFAGVLAIAVRSVGFVAKLLYEAIEEINPAPVEAMRATGATPAQVFVYGIIPQITPAFASIALLRWDINIRESTVVGYVGAGGLGLVLRAAQDDLRWGHVSLILLGILVLVVIGEYISARLRARIT